MYIEPYKSVDGLLFGSSQFDAIERFGEPKIDRVNRDHEIEYHFDGFIIRFDAECKQFRECTLLPEINATLNEEEIEWNRNYFEKLVKRYGNSVEVFGFIVLLDIGMAFSGFHIEEESQKAIHFFREGDWDEFRDSMKPFSL